MKLRHAPNRSTDTLPDTLKAPETHAINRRDLLRIARNGFTDHGLYRRGCTTGTGSLVVEYCDSRLEVPITHDDVGFPRGVETPGHAPVSSTCLFSPNGCAPPWRAGAHRQRSRIDQIQMGNPSILDELRPALRSSIAALAEDLLGPPNTQNGRELRWGAKGSFRVIVSGPKQGACCDFEGGWKGDPLALIMRERCTDFQGAIEYGCQFVGIAFDGKSKPEDPAQRAARDAERERKRVERRAWSRRPTKPNALPTPETFGAPADR